MLHLSKIKVGRLKKNLILKKNFLNFLLLFSLFFNIAHASIVNMDDDCHHESSHQHAEEESNTIMHSDLCNAHHHCHFMAIIDTSIIALNNIFMQSKLTHKHTRHSPPLQEANIKPPII